MRERAAQIFPFAIAVILPPAGLILGFFTAEEDQEFGVRIMAVAAMALGVWAIYFALS